VTLVVVVLGHVLPKGDAVFCLMQVAMFAGSMTRCPVYWRLVRTGV
jgi:hypothetical protein